MRALTLRQPWASLVALGHKTIETRGWSTKYRGPLLIHAGKSAETADVGEFNVERDNPRGTEPAYLLRGPIGWPYRLPLGAVVATCTLADVVPILARMDLEPINRFVRVLDPAEDDMALTFHPQWGVYHDCSAQLPYGDFAPGRYAWLLADVRYVQPVPAKGRQGLWTPNPEVLAKLAAWGVTP